jgi:hypothetical protein
VCGYVAHGSKAKLSPEKTRFLSIAMSAGNINAPLSRAAVSDFMMESTVSKSPATPEAIDCQD